MKLLEKTSICLSVFIVFSSYQLGAATVVYNNACPVTDPVTQTSTHATISSQTTPTLASMPETPQPGADEVVKYIPLFVIKNQQTGEVELLAAQSPKDLAGLLAQCACNRKPLLLNFDGTTQDQKSLLDAIGHLGSAVNSTGKALFIVICVSSNALVQAKDFLQTWCWVPIQILMCTTMTPVYNFLCNYLLDMQERWTGQPSTTPGQ